MPSSPPATCRDMTTIYPDTGAVCLAVLRRDGFISLGAGEEVGIICTQPFTLNGDSLFVNIDVPNGELGVEMLSTDGETLAASARLHGDYPAARIAWTEGEYRPISGANYPPPFHPAKWTVLLLLVRFNVRNTDLRSLPVQEL